ncbi:hypothetical protein D3C74_292000 [compost metagenome]
MPLVLVAFAKPIRVAPAPHAGSFTVTNPFSSIRLFKSPTCISPIIRQRLYGVKNCPFQWLPSSNCMNNDPRKSCSGSASKASTTAANSSGKIFCSLSSYLPIRSMYIFSRCSNLAESNLLVIAHAAIRTKSDQTCHDCCL